MYVTAVVWLAFGFVAALFAWRSIRDRSHDQRERVRPVWMYPLVVLCGPVTLPLTWWLHRVIGVEASKKTA
jgi:hypothetical protein